MRNLKHLQRFLVHSDFDSNVTGMAIAENTVFVLSDIGDIYKCRIDTSSEPLNACILYYRLESHFECAESDKSSKNVWRWIEYVTELDALIVGHENGVLLSVSVSESIPMHKKAGRISQGIQCIAWTSTKDLAALVTGEDTILVLNLNWQVLHERPIQQLLPALYSLRSSQISVCWRDDCKYLAVDVGVDIVLQDDSAKDGNRQNAAEINRMLLILEHTLSLHAVGQSEYGKHFTHHQDVLTWCPNQSLIGSSAVLKDTQISIIFFERNGKCHGEFTIPRTYTHDSYRVRSLSWSLDSTILAVILDHKETTDNSLQLWVRQNYHWYLKKEYPFARRNWCIQSFMWDEENANVFHIIVRRLVNVTAAPKSRDDCGWHYFREQLKWDVDVHLATSRIAVVDGNSLLVTALNTAIIPPPSAHKKIICEGIGAINSVCFTQKKKNSAIALLASDNRIIIIPDYSSTDEQVSYTEKIISDSIKELVSIIGAYDAESKSCFLLATSYESGQVLIIKALNGEYNIHERANLKDVQNLVCLHHFASNTNDYIAQQSDGSTHMLSVDASGDAIVRPWNFGSESKTPFFKMEAMQKNSESETCIRTLVGLTDKGRLYIDDVHFLSSVSSIMYIPALSILFVTTYARPSQLLLIPYQILIQAAQKKHVTGDLVQRCARRSIELQSQLLAVNPMKGQVILQAPRGNVELVTPRSLTLLLILKLLEEKSYFEALEMCRKHRVDLNLLSDFDSKAFMLHMPEFLNSLKDSKQSSAVSDRLCLFITNLHPINMWETKYISQVQEFVSIEKSELFLKVEKFSDKSVNGICKALADGIKDLQRGTKVASADSFLLPLLTCYIKQQPPCYHEALHIVQDLLINQLEQAKRCIKYLGLLTDIDAMYEEALGMYDIGLARFISTFSQRDPKQFVPFLESIEALQSSKNCRTGGTALLCQYQIDMHLQRHKSAIQSLMLYILQLPSECTQEREELCRDCVQIVINNEMHDTALETLAQTCVKMEAPPEWIKSFYKKLILLKAECLESEYKEYEQAAYMYLSLQERTRALKAFTAAREWRMAMSVASEPNCMDRKKLDELRQHVAYQLAEDMKSALIEVAIQEKQLMVHAAARLYIDYCDDVQGAIALLTQQKQWQEGLRLALLHERSDLLTREVESGVRQQYDELLEELWARSVKFKTCSTRLMEIRRQRHLFELHGVNEQWNKNRNQSNDNSCSSLASSSVAGSSAASSTSSIQSKVGSHNNVEAGNFSFRSLADAASSHFYATQTINSHSYANSTVSKSSVATQKQKKERRQRRSHRYKPGSVEEEQYMIQCCEAAIPDAALQHETSQIYKMLVYFSAYEEATSIQKQLQANLDLIRASLLASPDLSDLRATGEAYAQFLHWKVNYLS